MTELSCQLRTGIDGTVMRLNMDEIGARKAPLQSNNPPYWYGLPTQNTSSHPTTKICDIAVRSAAITVSTRQVVFYASKTILQTPTIATPKAVHKHLQKLTSTKIINHPNFLATAQRQNTKTEITMLIYSLSESSFSPKRQNNLSTH